MDFLGGTIHWGSTCSSIPPGCDQSPSFQIKVITDWSQNTWCFYLWPLMFQDNDQAELVQFLCFFFLFFVFCFNVYVYVRCVILLACVFFKEPSFLVYFVQREVSDGPHLCWWACMFGCEFVYCQFRNNTDQTYFFDEQTYFNLMHCSLTYFNPNY